MKRLLLFTLAAFMATSHLCALDIEEGWEVVKPALPSRTVNQVKPWTENANVANTLTTSKDKQKFEALLTSATAILDGQQVAQQKQRFTSNWKALDEQIGRSNWGLSPSAWLEGISWRDRLVGIHTALEYILGQINAKQAYAATDKVVLISELSELISKIGNKLK